MPQIIRTDDLLLRLIKDVNDIRSALRRSVSNIPLYDISNENTPPMITANQNNYVPGNFDVLRISSDSQRTITGFRGGVKGRFLRLFNVGISEIVLSHLDGLSLPENQIQSFTGFDVILNAGGEIILYYDIDSSKWRTSFASSADHISAELRLTFMQSIADSTWTDIFWDYAIRDTGGFFDPALPNYVTVPETGWYDVCCTLSFSVNPTGSRQTLLRTYPDSSQLSLLDTRVAVTGSNTVVTMGRTCYLWKGNAIVLRVYQDSGGLLLVDPNASAALGTCLIISKAG